MSISAVVPVFNGRELLVRLLDSLEQQTEPAQEVLVIDNGSTDGAPEEAARRGARVIGMGRNAGFAAAVNRGIGESSGEWIAVLNSDVVLAPDYFALLSATGSWFATGRILSADGNAVDGTFDVVCRGGTAWRVGSGRADGPIFQTACAIGSAPWTAALFRAELFRRVGVLEESFESYLEDVDFGLRCAAHRITGQYVPQAVAWHEGSATLGRWHPETVRRISRNQVLLLSRHYSREAILACFWPIAVAQLLWGGVALRHGATLPWLLGKLQGCRMFSAARRRNAEFDPGLPGLLRANEETIRRVQQATGFDAYWASYFKLTGTGVK